MAKKSKIQKLHSPILYNCPLVIGKANEKPHVENSVFDLQRDWATPVPKVKDYDELNDYLTTSNLRIPLQSYNRFGKLLKSEGLMVLEDVALWDK